MKDPCDLCIRRGEEILRALGELARVERQRDQLRERAESAAYWQQRARRAESEVAGLELEIARREMNGG